MHRWGEPRRPDLNTTFRDCLKCGLVKVSRHEPDNFPPHWIEWEFNGKRSTAEKTPACVATLEKNMPKKTAATQPIEASPYRLISLEVENFKKLKAVRIDVTGSVVEIAGRNEQGKSSVLDAVMAAIGGKDYFPPQPIREGEKESVTSLDFGALKLTRRIWRKKDKSIAHDVKIEFADGRSPQYPQAYLDELRGSPIADDPLEFTRLKPKERADLLKKLVPDVNFTDIAKARAELFVERTNVGRDRDRAKAAAALIEVPSGTPSKLVDVTELSKELTGVSLHNSSVEQETRRREATLELIEQKRDEADSIERRVKILRGEADELQARYDALQPAPQRKDDAQLAAQIQNAEAQNNAIRKRIEREARLNDADTFETHYDTLTDAIEALDKKKTDAIAGAKLPVEGLTVGDDDIELDGLPFEQASTARKIRVATALLMALKPELRVLLVREGSLLDSDARAALAADAEANGFVVLMETVGPGTGGIVIEDGEVA